MVVTMYGGYNAQRGILYLLLTGLHLSLTGLLTVISRFCIFSASLSLTGVRGLVTWLVMFSSWTGGADTGATLVFTAGGLVCRRPRFLAFATCWNQAAYAMIPRWSTSGSDISLAEITGSTPRVLAEFIAGGERENNVTSINHVNSIISCGESIATCMVNSWSSV